MDFTKQQQRVIETRNSDILVPASAGSGKTTVLVERVLQLLKDDPHLSIEDFLLMTFTKDAAKNMRVKIQRALANSDDQRLAQQSQRVALADISTIHAFCQEIIRRYYYVIDLDPQYRLMSDDTEIVLLQNQAWDDVREAEYVADEAEKTVDDRLFDRLVANFAGDRSDDQLHNVVSDLYYEAIAKPNPQAWLESLKDAYHLDGDDAADWEFFQKQLKPRMLKQLKADYQLMGEIAKTGAEEKLGAFAEQLADDQEQLAKLQSAVEAGQWETIRALLDDAFPTAKRKGLKKGSDKMALYQELKPQRDAIKERTKQWTDYFALSAKQVNHLSAQAAVLVGKLAEVVERFIQRYQELKQERHLLDFADLEHFAYRILTTDSEEGHRAQDELRHRYREMMVDEYQDTNELQDEILNCLHEPGYNHLFMVGDVKQAIYRFRQADPTIFRQRNREFADHPEKGTSIPLAHNFRSMPNVLNFINSLFEQLMDETLGDVDYDGDAKLKFGASWYQQGVDHPVELMLYSANHTPANGQSGEFEADKVTGEVQMIAMRIKQLMKHDQLYDPDLQKERPIEYKDIAILSRTKGINDAIVQQFGLEDIPVTVRDVNNFFASTEVRLMLDLLSLLDNPYQDIPLVAVLRSPIVGMTEPEMAYLRLVNRNIPYYQVLMSYHLNANQHLAISADAAEVDLAALQEKVDTFMDHLQSWRELAQRQSLVNLLWTIYRETGYLDYVGGMPGGEQRQANLHALYQRADSYEKRGYQGVYQFVRFIKQLQERDQDIGQAVRQTTTNSVSVMTIHGSKGLEFPIVFLADTAHHFKNNTSNTSIDAKAGIGISVIEHQPAANEEKMDQSTSVEDLLGGIQVRYLLPQKQLIADESKAAERAEDLRILYVALTRAEQRLIITGSVNDRQKRSINQLIKMAELASRQSSTVLPAAFRLKAPSYLAWILMGLVRFTTFPHNLFDQPLDAETSRRLSAHQPLFTVQEFDQRAVGDQLAQLRQPADQAEAQQTAGATLTNEERQWINRVLNFKYGHRAATEATAFQSVSMIRGMVSTDPDDLEMGQITFDKDKAEETWEDVDVLSTPRFARTDDKRPPRRVVGTATHLVFQKMDLTRPVEERQVNDEISRLLDQGLIPSPEVAKAIDAAGIAAFYQTAIGKALLRQPETVHREQPFNMIIPAGEINKDLGSDDGHILIHGIIDGLQYQDDGIVLFDYKTDARQKQESQKAFEQRMLDHYAGQLTLYADALNKMSAGGGRQTAHGKPLRVVRQYLYLVTTRTLLPVPLLK